MAYTEIEPRIEVPIGEEHGEKCGEQKSCFVSVSQHKLAGCEQADSQSKNPNRGGERFGEYNLSKVMGKQKENVIKGEENRMNREFCRHLLALAHEVKSSLRIHYFITPDDIIHLTKLLFKSLNAVVCEDVLTSNEEFRNLGVRLGDKLHDKRS